MKMIYSTAKPQPKSPLLKGESGGCKKLTFRNFNVGVENLQPLQVAFLHFPAFPFKNTLIINRI